MKEKKKFSLTQLYQAIRFSNNNKDELMRAVLCGCYECERIFLGNDVRYYESGKGKCPFCRSAHIIAESSAYPLNHEFLRAVKQLKVEKV